MCIILRLDLDMTVGKLISQACHAAVEASELSKKNKHKTWYNWRNEGAKKVALGVESILELEEIVTMAEEEKIVNVTIKDSGLTEIPPGSITAIGLGPDRSEKMDKITGTLKLF
jgi:PTH2 family peptidyl-tRNA hydrolase